MNHLNGRATQVTAEPHMVDASDEVKARFGPKIEAWTRRILAMIDSDVAAYTVVGPVRCWHDLSGHVDSNEYSIAAGIPDGTDAEALGAGPYDLVHAAQASVDRALHGRACNDLCAARL